MVNPRPLAAAIALNSSRNCPSKRSIRTGPRATAALPLSSFEMFSKASRIPSTDIKAACALSNAPRAGAVIAGSSIAAINNLAADKGCNKSWLAAATKRDRLALARSAVASASCSSSVRARTRASSVSFARLRASIADRSAVTSLKLITKPDSGISWAKTARIIPCPRRISKLTAGRPRLPATQSANPCAVMPPKKSNSASRLWAICANPVPSRIFASGSASNAPSRWFHPTRQASASKMATP